MDLQDKKFFIRTFGCQMNANDSEKIAGVLSARGARPAQTEEDAEILIVNTCAVREKSEEKLYSYLGRIRGLKRKSGVLIGVVGCVAQIRRDDLLGLRPFVDFAVGPDNYLELPQILDRSLSGQVAAVGRSKEWRETPPALFLRDSPVTAYVTIMEGCDHFCAYCVVPFARGREKFRPLAGILAELDDLAGRGYKEIQLLGQNVNSYRDPKSGTGFAALLAAAARRERPEWIRFLTSHPRNFTRDIAAAMSASPRICRQLHLPLQSGSSTVLARMNRGYTREEYLERIGWLREALPDISLSTDIIVGFPGETEEEFRDTLSALETIRFAAIFSFRYSPRPGTAAARGLDDVPLEVKRRRLIEVQALQKRIQTEIHGSMVGSIRKVLAVGPSKKDPAAFSGRTEGYQVVNFHSAEDVTGRFVRLEISGCGPYSLRGRLV